MPLSTTDHAEAFIAQFRRAMEEKERELLDMKETYQAMLRAPGYLKGAALTHAAEKVVSVGTRTLANRNVTKLTREWLAEYSKYDEKIDINTIRDDLKRQGVKGKDRSLYSSIHVILKDEHKAGRLGYKAGFGFFKSRKEPTGLTREDPELVTSS